MLVRIAESERMRVAAQSQAVEASDRIENLATDLERARQRVAELEEEVAGIRQQWALSEERLSAARDTMSSALGVLEAMERREEMATSMRARAMREAVRALGGEPESHGTPLEPARGADPASGTHPASASVAPPSSGRDQAAESTVEILGTHELEWDMDMAK